MEVLARKEADEARVAVVGFRKRQSDRRRKR